MVKEIVKKAAGSSVAEQAKAAVTAQAGEKKARVPPAPTGFTTDGVGDKRVPYTKEEIVAQLNGKPAAVYLVPREWRGKQHFSIVVWNGSDVQATKGGCFGLERAQGFRDMHARTFELGVADSPDGQITAPPPARARGRAAAEAGDDETQEGGEEEASVPAPAPAPAPKKAIKKAS